MAYITMKKRKNQVFEAHFRKKFHSNVTKFLQTDYFQKVYLLRISPCRRRSLLKCRTKKKNIIVILAVLLAVSAAGLVVSILYFCITISHKANPLPVKASAISSRRTMKRIPTHIKTP